MNNQNNQTTGPEGTIQVDDAIEMTKNWRHYMESADQKFDVKSYLVPIINFKNILKYNPDAEAVRAYIGLADENDPASSQLILVPVVDGKDVLYINTDEGGLLAADEQSNVYDITKACPPSCSTTGSPLGS